MNEENLLIVSGLNNLIIRNSTFLSNSLENKGINFFF